MTSTETLRSTEPLFTLRESQTASPAPDRFLIRPESLAQREWAIQQFEAEAPREEEKRTSRPGVNELLLNAETLLRAGEKSTASHLVRQALALDSHNVEALRKMLRCLGHREWELAQAMIIHRELARIEPTFQNFADYGHALLKNEKADEALDAYFEATLRVQEENDSLFEVYKNIGNIYVRRGDFDAAEEAYHKAFALHPDSDVLQVNLGTLAVQKQDWAGALEKFRRALEFNALNDKAWVGVGLCHQQVGDGGLAQAALLNALDICPANRTAVHLLASWSLRDGSARQAAERLQDYLATCESDVEMSLVLIHLFCHTHQFELAEIELERALCWAPDREDLLALKARFPANQEKQS